MNSDKKQADLSAAAAELVLRELDEVEARDIFGGDGGWVKVGPVTPVPPTPTPVKPKQN